MTILVIAIAIALPMRSGSNWVPFVPHRWWAVGTAANILVWLFVGWEAVALLAGEFTRLSFDLPRAMALAFGTISVLYLALAIATVGVSRNFGLSWPLADLAAEGLGKAGRVVTAVLAVAPPMGTMNVYMGGGGKLALALADTGALPRWFGYAAQGEGR